MSVAELLRLSREAHQRYRENTSRRVPNGTSTIAIDGDAIAAGEALTEACRLRVEAQALDPKRVDPAWADQSGHDHDELLTFYADQLGRLVGR